MGVRFKSTFSAPKRLSEIKQRNKVNLGAALSVTKAEMLKDIESGKGYDGAAMPEYSKQYKAYKQSKGRKGNVDLTFTGRMLKAMQVSVLDMGDKLLGRLYFLAGERDKARFNLDRRKFFGLSQKNIERLRKTLGIK